MLITKECAINNPEMLNSDKNPLGLLTISLQFTMSKYA